MTYPKTTPITALIQIAVITDPANSEKTRETIFFFVPPIALRIAYSCCRSYTAELRNNEIDTKPIKAHKIVLIAVSPCMPER
jgi:hypothetical protein